MILSALLAVASCVQEPAWAQAPISYGTRATTDPIALFDAQLGSGERTLRPDGKPLTIEAVLAALNVPVSSQVTVFSSASLQARRITPERPRALYFNDDVYIGFVPGGRLIEVAAIDPVEGIAFYTLNRRAKEPRFQRETHRCLQCHAPSQSGGLPAHLLRSLHPEPNGEPRFGAGSTYVDPTTPYEDRWGGWYVTGHTGEMAHIGNQFLAEDQKQLSPQAGRHLSLAKLCDSSAFPTDTSDIVALLVLEHQTQVQNALVWGGYEARRALDYQRALNEALGEPEGTPVGSTTSRLRSATTKIVDALIGVGEAPLPCPVGRRSGFAADFQEAGRQDPQGRSLRDLDLQTRLFRYPMSYAIDSVAAKSLPGPLRDLVWTRLGELFLAPLREEDREKYGPYLNAENQAAVREILLATMGADLPPAWQREQ